MCLDLCLDARSICGFTEARILSKSLLLHYSRCRLSLIYGKYFIFYRSFSSWICKAVTWQKVICQMYVYACRNFNYLVNIFSVTPTTWLPNPFPISFYREKVTFQDICALIHKVNLTSMPKVLHNPTLFLGVVKCQCPEIYIPIIYSTWKTQVL